MTGVPGDPCFASVAVPVPVRRLFTYEVGRALGDVLEPGSRVRVPFGRRKVVGTVVEWPAAPPDPGVQIKPIDSVLGHVGPLPASLLALTRFVADYYLCSWGEAIETALPPDPGPLPRRRAVRRASAGSWSPAIPAPAGESCGTNRESVSARHWNGFLRMIAIYC